MRTPYSLSGRGRRSLLFVSFVAVALAGGCGGGGGGGGGSTPPITPNASPVIGVPTGLSGSSPRFTKVLATGDTAALRFTATDPDGDALEWLLAVPPSAAAAVGLQFATPVRGAIYQFDLAAVSATASVVVQLLVQDARGAAAAIDLTIVRSGAPTIAAVTPDAAYAPNGQTVTITGTGFSLGGTVTPAVRFAGLPASDVVVVDDATLRCTSPDLGSLFGPVAVAVTQTHGTAQLPASAFTAYRFPPRFAAQDAPLASSADDALAIEIAANGSTGHVVWIASAAVNYRRSSDRGASWSAAVVLDSAEVATEPQIAVDGDAVTVAWIGNGNAVWVRTSADAGQTFAPAQRLDPVFVPDEAASRPRIASSGDRRYVTWIEGSTLGFGARAMVRASANGGATWQPVQGVSQSAGRQGHAQIACSGATAWVVFEDDGSTGSVARGIYVSRTIDGGTSWSAGLRLSRPGFAASSPELSADGDLLTVAWTRDGIIWLNDSQDGGRSWRSAEQQLRGSEAGVLGPVRLAREGRRVFAIYASNGSDVWLSRSSDGVQFPDHVALSTGTLPVGEFAIGCRGNYAFAAWRRGDVGATVARLQRADSTNGGTIWSAASGLGDGTGAQEQPVLASNGPQLWLAWLDHRGVGVAPFANSTTP